MEQLSRRCFLTGGAASLVGLAGCQGLDGALGQDGGNSGVAGSAFIRNSVYTPDIHKEVSNYGYLYAAPKTVAEQEENLSTEFVETFASTEDRFEQLGLDFDSITELVYYDNGQIVVSATIPIETVRDRLDSLGFRRQSTVGSFELFTTPNSSSLVSVSEEELFITRPVGSTSARDVAEAIVGLRNGQTSGYVETHPAFASVLEALGETSVAVGQGQSPPETENVPRGQFKNVVAKGVGVMIADSDSTVRMAFAFTEDATPNTDAVERWLDETDNMQEPLNMLTEINVETNATSVVVTANAATTDLHPDLFSAF